MNALLLALALAADPTTPTTSTAKTHDVAEAEKLVKSIYDDYVAHQQGKSGMPKSIDQQPISKAARALYEQGTKVKSGSPGIGFDPVIDAQDWTLSDVVVTGEKTASGVVVHAGFKNFGGQHALDYYVIRENGKLVIDDIKKTTGTPLWTWREELKRAADNAKKQQP